MLAVFLLFHHVAALAGSICKSAPKLSNDDPTFCLSVKTYDNATTSSGDLHMSFTHDRYDNSTLGWIAFGPGILMDGALMFVIYGNPQAAAPTVSVRTAHGHEPPVEIARQRGIDIRMQPWWSFITESHARANVDIACYGCTLWTGTDISALSEEQTFIWAFNSAQDFEGTFTPDSGLEIHSHFDTGTIEMDSYEASDDTPFNPKADKATTAITESQSRRPGLWKLHGLLTTSAFLLFLPLGQLAIRSGSKSSFTIHWILQCAAGIMILVGVGMGLFLSQKLSLTHQYLGLALGLTLIVQALLGYRHHVVYLRIRRPTWLSESHVWLGRCLMLGGFANVLLGLVLKGYSSRIVTITAITGSLECLGALFTWLRWRSGKPVGGDPTRVKRTGKRHLDVSEGRMSEEIPFTLATDEDEDEEADDS